MIVKVLIVEKYVKYFHFVCMQKHSFKIYKIIFSHGERLLFTLLVIDRLNQKNQIDNIIIKHN